MEETEDGFKRDLGNGRTLWLKFQIFNVKIAVGATDDELFYDDGY